MVACEECSSPQVAGLRWYHWLELRSRWRRQQYSHFDTACQRPKGKLHFLFAVMIPPSAARYFRHLPAMSIRTTLHATAPLLYPCRRYPKCPWGLYASPPPVAMAVVGWFLCFPSFFLEKWVFFSHTRLTPKKKVYATYTKKKNFRRKKTRLTPKNKSYATYAKKKIKKRLTLISTIELCFPPPGHTTAPPVGHVPMTVLWTQTCIFMCIVHSKPRKLCATDAFGNVQSHQQCCIFLSR